MTASAFSTTLILPIDALEITEGQTDLGGSHNNEAGHQQCDWSKSWIYTTQRPEFAAVNLRATMLDVAGCFDPLRTPSCGNTSVGHNPGKAIV